MVARGQELAPGSLVGDRYEIEGVIGRGGMGTVYGALHTLTHRRVALKVVTWGCPEERGDREGRFLSEARNAVAVRHPHVVDVLDMGLHGGEPFLVMERLEGESLDDFIVRRGPLAPDLALALILPIMGALAALHDRGIVHRDIKPSNIYLAGGAGEVIVPKLLDFGLSRALTDVRMTRQGVVLGTPLYMAPEHASGMVTGPQSDVWSLGVVLFECLTGALPYASTEPHVVATHVLAGHVLRVQSVTSAVPPALGEAVDRALFRDLSRRYTDMRAFASEIVAAALSDALALPENPEPVGLPEYRAWLARNRLPAQRPVSRPAQPVVGEALRAAAPSPSASDLAERKPSWRVPTAVAALVLALTLFLVLRLSARPVADVATPPAAAFRPATDPPRAQPNTPAPSVHPLDPTARPDPSPNPSSVVTNAASSERRTRRRSVVTTDTRGVVTPAAPVSEIETEWK